jgi:spermidine/putrescine transport system substrate-binding protein/spermidine/putrescine transport system permease protein
MKTKINKNTARIWAALCVTALLLSSAAGCADGTGSGAGAAGAGESKDVNLIIWTEYIPDSVLQGFEERAGVKVNLTTFSSVAEGTAKIQGAAHGTYDVIIGGAITILNEGGYLEKLDKSKLSNLGNIKEVYLTDVSDPAGEYSVPYMGASVVVAVNTDYIKEEITSYQDLLNPAYADNMVVIEDSRAVIGIASMAQGYDINDRSDESLEAAEVFLQALKPNIHAYNGDSPKTLMINGECHIGLIYGAECALAMDENPAIVGYYPKEGVYFGFDRMLVDSQAKNRENAYAFIDYLLEPEVSAEISKAFPYVNPNDAAFEFLDESFVSNPMKNMPDDVAARTHAVTDGTGEESSKETAIWNRLKG